MFDAVIDARNGELFGIMFDAFLGTGIPGRHPFWQPILSKMVCGCVVFEVVKKAISALQESKSVQSSLEASLDKMLFSSDDLARFLDPDRKVLA